MVDKRATPTSTEPEQVAPTVNESNQERRYTERERQVPTKSKINDVTIERIDEEPSPKKALRKYDAQKWQDATKTKLNYWRA